MTPLPIATEIAHLSREAAGIDRNAAFAALGLCLRTLQDITKKGGKGIDMTTDQFLELLRGATEDDIDAALEGALFDMPINNTAELLEVYNRILDILTGDRDAAEAMDIARIATARRGSD